MSRESEEVVPETPQNGAQAEAEQEDERKALRIIGWFSVGMAVATVGIYLGYALRCRYKFNHRTPYDFYSNAEPQAATDFGVGI
jgi:hypothetical protein